MPYEFPLKSLPPSAGAKTFECASRQGPYWTYLSKRIKRQPGAALWIGSVFAASLILGVLVLAFMGTGEKGIIVALRFTARLMFLPFWLAYTGRAMRTLFGPVFGGLARHVRDFGLCFAAALPIHIGLVIWLFRISDRRPLSASAILLFSIGAICAVVLALFSIQRLRNSLNPKLWRGLLTVSNEYIAFLFFLDFVVNPILNGANHPIMYLPFSSMVLIAPLLRLAATIWPWGREIE
jgi:hypothetical protein